MVAVNLLPWRAWRWQRQRRQSMIALGLTLLLLTLVVLLLYWQEHQALIHVRRQHAQLSPVLERLVARAEQQKHLLQQLDGLQQQRVWLRQQSRQFSVWQQLWQDLPVMLPDGLWLTRLEKHDAQLLLEGRALQMQAIRHFRQRLTGVAFFAQIRQGNVQRQPEGDYHFTLRIKLKEEVSE